LAITDHLTGAYNRRYFYHVTDRILARAEQTRGRVMLLLYDIDDFKHYNETYGHAAGDDILRETAALMRQTTREHDVVARIGGDEFAVLFWDQERPRVPNSRPIQAVYELSERFRRAVTLHQFKSLGPEAQGVLTISGGLASFPKDGVTRVELMRSADHALREAKRAGKNSIKLIG
jgi:diguanylate cyclase (GGDEF)-like protein